jgi:hypothetical protein
MGKSSGTDRGGFGGGDGTFRGEIKNARDLATIKDGAVYKEMKDKYEEEMIEASTDVMNEVFDKFENDVDVGE